MKTKASILEFTNPVTRTRDKVISHSELGRAVQAVRDGKRGSKKALKALCRQVQADHRAVIVRATPAFQRDALVKSAVKAGRTISWRSFAPHPMHGTDRDYVFGALKAL